MIVIVASRLLVRADKDPERLGNKEVFAQIIKVGLPSAMETAFYNVAMTLTIRFLNQMDDAGLNVTARSYAAQIANFSYCVGAALAQANAILTDGGLARAIMKPVTREPRRLPLSEYVSQQDLRQYLHSARIT